MFGDAALAAGKSFMSQEVLSAVRNAWSICPVANEPGMRYFVPLKNNLTKKGGVVGFGFQDAARGAGDETATLGWGEYEDVRDAAEVLAEVKAHQRFAGQRVPAETLLKCMLCAGSMASAAVLELAREQGISEKAVRHVYRCAGGKPRKIGMNGGWVWDWPSKWEHPGEGAGLGAEVRAEVRSVARAEAHAKTPRGEEEGKTPGISEDGSGARQDPEGDQVKTQADEEGEGERELVGRIVIRSLRTAGSACSEGSREVGGKEGGNAACDLRLRADGRGC